MLLVVIGGGAACQARRLAHKSSHAVLILLLLPPQVFNLLSPTAQGWVGPVDRFVTNMSRSRWGGWVLGWCWWWL